MQGQFWRTGNQNMMNIEGWKKKRTLLERRQRTTRTAALPNLTQIAMPGRDEGEAMIGHIEDDEGINRRTTSTKNPRVSSTPFSGLRAIRHHLLTNIINTSTLTPSTLSHIYNLPSNTSSHSNTAINHLHNIHGTSLRDDLRPPQHSNYPLHQSQQTSSITPFQIGQRDQPLLGRTAARTEVSMTQRTTILFHFPTTPYRQRKACHSST